MIRYSIKNNSASREVPRFYIDHTASTANGGFVITTQENRVKSVVGFSRYKLSIPAGHEISLDVVEEASQSHVLSTSRQIRDFLNTPVCLDQMASTTPTTPTAVWMDLVAEMRLVLKQHAQRQMYHKVRVRVRWLRRVRLRVKVTR